jgi:hypothetical protein
VLLTRQNEYRSSRNYTRDAPERLSWMAPLDKIAASQSAATRRQSPSPRSSRFGPSGHSVAALETRAARAFAFLGRCFVMVSARADARLSAPVSVATPTDSDAYELGCEQGSIPCQSGEGAMPATPGIAPGQSAKRGTSARHHHKAPSSSGRALTQQTGECRRRTQESDGAMSAPAPLALPQGPARTGNAEPCTSGPRYGRLQVECGPFGSGSPCQSVQSKRWPEGTWDASGLTILSEKQIAARL